MTQAISPARAAAAALIAERKLLYLSRAEVLASGGLAWDRLIEAVAEAYRVLASGGAMMPKADYLRYPGRSGYDRIIALFGHLGGRFFISGLKQICSSTSNAAAGFPRASGLLILNDPQTNRPFAVMDATAISAARTAAVTGLALRLFARHKTNEIAIIGCGELAQAHLSMLACVLDPAGVMLNIADLDEGRRAAFCDAAGAAGFACREVASVEAAVRASDTVLPMTTSDTAHIRLDWLRPGCFYSAVSLLDAELDIYRQARCIIVDDLAQCLGEGRPLQRLEQAGELDRSRIMEIGRWLASQQSMEPEDYRPIVFNPMGTVITDLAAGLCVFEAALERGLGVRLDL